MKKLDVNFDNQCYIINVDSNSNDQDNLIYICEKDSNKLINFSKNMIKLGRYFCLNIRLIDTYQLSSIFDLNGAANSIKSN